MKDLYTYKNLALINSIILAIEVSLFGQLVISSLVEYFGLFGMSVNRLKKDKKILN